jgi:hypothetical protein
MDFTKAEKDKKYMFKEEMKNDPRKIEEFNNFLDNLNNPSMGIAFLKKKYPVLYEKYHVFY